MRHFHGPFSIDQKIGSDWLTYPAHIREQEMGYVFDDPRSVLSIAIFLPLWVETALLLTLAVSRCFSYCELLISINFCCTYTNTCCVPKCPSETRLVQQGNLSRIIPLGVVFETQYRSREDPEFLHKYLSDRPCQAFNTRFFFLALRAVVGRDSDQYCLRYRRTC
jgi:hypothetical protein